ncbi:4'-phosphopantetheinyl transferase family protein [Auritidibacter ignavus]|uniref:4'-phosphopantetheinyl transferase family protein n=1 Tax=Auritidibacter ignavus TaxID=678932 RepID=UPI00109C3DB7
MHVHLIDSAFIALTHTPNYSRDDLRSSERVLTDGWNPHRQAEFATGRSCARAALERLGFEAPEILRHKNGAPVWPRLVRGSITHCKEFYAAIVGHERDYVALGIDAEPNERLPDYLIQRFATGDELHHVRRLQSKQSHFAWDRLLFCSKEAVFKAASEAHGLSLVASEIRVEFEPEEKKFIARCSIPASRYELDAVFHGRYWLVRGTVLSLVLVRRLGL